MSMGDEEMGTPERAESRLKTIARGLRTHAELRELAGDPWQMDRACCPECQSHQGLQQKHSLAYLSLARSQHNDDVHPKLSNAHPLRLHHWGSSRDIISPDHRNDLSQTPSSSSCRAFPCFWRRSFIWRVCTVEKASFGWDSLRFFTPRPAIEAAR